MKDNSPALLDENKGDCLFPGGRRVAYASNSKTTIKVGDSS
jgi:hypothetical protein